MPVDPIKFLIFHMKVDYISKVGHQKSVCTLGTYFHENLWTGEIILRFKILAKLSQNKLINSRKKLNKITKIVVTANIGATKNKIICEPTKVGESKVSQT